MAGTVTRCGCRADAPLQGILVHLLCFVVSLGSACICVSGPRSTAFYVPTPHSGHTAHSHRVTRCHVSVSQSARPGPPVCAALLLGVGGTLGQRGPEQHVGGWAEHWEAEGRQAG